MRKFLLLMCALLGLGVSGAWADVLPTAAVASWMYDSSNPFLTLRTSDDATITTADDGDIVIHASNLWGTNTSRSMAAVAMVVNMPDEAPGSFANFFCLKTASTGDDAYTGAIGLGVTTDKKLKGTWGNSEWTSGGGVVTTSAVTGEHTIIMLCNNSGTTIYVDDASTSVNKDGLKCATQWTDLRIESAYKNCVKKVFVFKGEQISNISSIFSELDAFTLVDVANEETKSVSSNSSAYYNVAAGGTLTVDVADYDLNKAFGGGDVVLNANTSLTGGKYTLVTGKLTINEGKTLTIGSGDGQTNSIASFTSIDLAGTINHNNSKATLNNVTVPSGKTGRIFAYDMGSEADAFKLAGTTTLTGGLVVSSYYNFQMKIDVLSGANSLNVCGSNGAFSEDATSSNENATINIANASGYTGTATLNNIKATINLAGNLVGSSWTKTNGTLTYTGTNLNGTTLDGAILEGSTRITTSNTVNIKNLAGNNLNNTDHLYAFVGGGTINFYGTCDLTKKSDGTDCNSANIGYGSSANVVIKAGANVTAGVVLNSATVTSNAPITVEATATLTAVGSTHADNSTLLIYSTNLTNNGTLNLNADGRGSIVSALSGSGTLNVASGSTIEAPSVPNTLTLTGAGDVVITTTFPTSTTAPTFSSWTGAITFPENLSATNITHIFNAWGNANSTIKLNNLSGYFSNTTNPVNPTLNILSGKTLTINNGFSDCPPTLNKLTGEGDLNISWTSSRDPYKLTVQKLEGFTGTLITANAPITVEKIVLASAPYANTLLIKTSGVGTVTLEKLYVGLQESTAYTWTSKTVENVTGIYVTDIDQVQICREMAVNAIAPYYNHIGTGVGKYTISLGLTNYNSIEEINSAIEAWTTTADYVQPSATINQPATNKFYRFNIGTNYMCNVAGEDNVRTVTTTSNDASTVFYLNADNHLIAYADGYGFNWAYCKTTDLAQTNGYEFSESSTIGKYLIHALDGTGHASNRYLTINESTSKLDAGQGAWNITEVTSLPVTFHGQYASFYSPIDLEIPEGVKAYTGALNGNWLTLTEQEYVPANTGVILKYAGFTSEESKDFTILNISRPVEGTALLGTTAAATVAANSTLVLGKDENDTWGLYKFTGTTLGGFKAYMNNTNNVKGFGFTFNDTDAIVSVLNGEQTSQGECYDLSGRRVSKPARGLYIVNGKKVVIK